MTKRSCVAALSAASARAIANYEAIEHPAELIHNIGVIAEELEIEGHLDQDWDCDFIAMINTCPSKVISILTSLKLRLIYLVKLTDNGITCPTWRTCKLEELKNMANVPMEIN